MQRVVDPSLTAQIREKEPCEPTPIRVGSGMLFWQELNKEFDTPRHLVLVSYSKDV